MTNTLTTPVPTRWGMFCEYGPNHEVIATPGDDCVTRQMEALALTIRRGQIQRKNLYTHIRDLQKRTVEAGFGEVHDTEPEWAIADFVNILCDEQGWKHVDRWEF